jgi:hypothetical protein
MHNTKTLHKAQLLVACQTSKPVPYRLCHRIIDIIDSVVAPQTCEQIQVCSCIPGFDAPAAFTFHRLLLVTRVVVPCNFAGALHELACLVSFGTLRGDDVV